MILKAIVCLKPFQPFCLQGSSGLLTIKKNLYKSSPASRFLCTKDRLTDTKKRSQINGQNGTQSKTIGQRKDEFCDNALDGKGKSFAPRQRTFFPKSVFAAGTAKRTTEMLKRKADLFSQNKEEPEGRTTRGRGRTYLNCLH